MRDGVSPDSAAGDSLRTGTDGLPPNPVARRRASKRKEVDTMPFLREILARLTIRLRVRCAGAEPSRAPGARAVAVLLLTMAACAAAAASAPEPPPATLAVVDIAGDFVTFWDATQRLPTDERVARFKRDVATKFPAFYGVERHGGRITQERQDARIANAIESFGPIRDAYRAKAASFARDMAAAMPSFLAAFPDFKPDVAVYVLHSLGEMDGGTRTFGGREYLIFGVDGIVRYHAGSRETAFFHHELFHVHHASHFGDCAAVWCGLWQEGLAVHVASELNPGATPTELMLSIPAGLIPDTERQLVASLEQLRAVLDSTDRRHVAGLFSGGEADGTGLPARRGYYLGLLVAREVAKGRGLDALARLPAEQAQPLVAEAVGSLLARARQGSPAR
jgi:hypothetical protein